MHETTLTHRRDSSLIFTFAGLDPAILFAATKKDAPVQPGHGEVSEMSKVRARASGQLLQLAEDRSAHLGGRGIGRLVACDVLRPDALGQHGRDRLV